MQRGVCAALYLSVCMVRQGRCLVGGAACVLCVPCAGPSLQAQRMRAAAAVSSCMLSSQVVCWEVPVAACARKSVKLVPVLMTAVPRLACVHTLWWFVSEGGTDRGQA